MEIIKDSWVEENIYFTLDYIFREDPTGGLSFPCDKDGKITKLNPGAEENLKYAQEHPEIYDGPRVIKHRSTYRHNPTIKCKCGKIFELSGFYYGACNCEKCGQWYNLFGQELLPPENWDWSNEDY